LFTGALVGIFVGRGVCFKPAMVGAVVVGFDVLGWYVGTDDGCDDGREDGCDDG